MSCGAARPKGAVHAHFRCRLVEPAVCFIRASVACRRAGQSELESVVITATRTGQSPDEILSATTVLTRSQIEASQARSIEDLLLGVEGISITNSGGPGKLTSFFGARD